MIALDEVERIHEILIDKFGGKKGLRDKGLLESSIQRPFQTFDQKELYPEPVDKAAAILENIISNHPFVDGNKGQHMWWPDFFFEQTILTLRQPRTRNMNLLLALPGVKFASTK